MHIILFSERFLSARYESSWIANDAVTRIGRDSPETWVVLKRLSKLDLKCGYAVTSKCTIKSSLECLQEETLFFTINLFSTCAKLA